MIRRFLLSLLALAVIVGLAVAVALLTPARRPAPETVELPKTSRAVCPVGGVALVGESDGLSVQPLDGEAVASADQTVTLEGPAVLRAESLLAAGVYLDAPQRAYAPCVPATTSGMVQVPEPGASELVIVNSDANAASVDLTLLGPDGEIREVGARGIALAPGTSRRVALSILAPEGPVGVAFRTSEGRVTVTAAALEGRPTRFAPSGEAAASHLITGIPTGATATTLVLTNPHEDRLDVDVQALGAHGTYEPATAVDVSVPPMTTITVDLAEALAGEASGIRVEAREEFGASVVTAVGEGSPTTLVAAAEAQRLAVNAPSGGELILTNPGVTPASVVVSQTSGDAQRLDVAPGSTAVVTIAEATPPVGIDVASDQPVVAAAASATEAGTVVVQGVQSTLAEVTGAPAHLDPTLR